MRYHNRCTALASKSLIKPSRSLKSRPSPRFPS
jgi:hypothetical protein